MASTSLRAALAHNIRRPLYAYSRAAATLHASSSSPSLPEQPPTVVPGSSSYTSPPVESGGSHRPSKRPSRMAPQIRASKAALTLTPSAVQRIRSLISGPTPQLVRVGVRNKGCAGMQYHLEYVEGPGKFDEIVQQDGVRVLIDSKALFSIIGSEMDWHEDRMSSKFIFKNPNIVDACGCGESFNVSAT
ncbi:hypothetical protein BS47DRAFT_1321581 [Hydnum rufescens UP504]|uniref:Iron-sulfur assembly protein 1 n=1 Tax=Hydnum rufescens UP504 TaxID=1448309 RepID=A0A9P6DQ50_9AGAM|nr:hypothetical protein BS47DRAFT_1321581 [Hydnum rufescens UP504]